MPTADQIAQAATAAQLQRRGARSHVAVRALSAHLGITRAEVQEAGDVMAAVKGRLGGLPKDAGFVLALGSSVPDKIRHVSTGEAIIKGFVIDDVVGVEPLARPEFQFMNQVKARLERQVTAAMDD